MGAPRSRDQGPTSLRPSTVMKNSDPGAEDGSYRPGEELQQDQTSQRDKGRGQEGPSSKKRDVQGSDQRQEGARRIRGWKSLQVNSRQQEWKRRSACQQSERNTS